MRAKLSIHKLGFPFTAGVLSAVIFIVWFAACAPAQPAPAPTATPVSSAVSTATPAPTAAPHSTPVPTPFTIAWFPDTQSSAWAEPEALSAMGAWIAENAARENIVYVLQTGDLVDNGYLEWQWQNFELAYDAFKDVVPYFCIAGNHDLGVKRQQWDGYLARPYAHTVPAEQEYAGGKAAYTLFSAGGVDFIVVGVGFGAEEECAKWVRDTFRAYPDRYGVLMVHDFLHSRGSYVDDNGECVYYRMLAGCPNVYLCLCGHFRGTCYRAFTFDDTYDEIPDRTVHTMLCNYQHFSHMGGQIRLLRFDPADGSMTVRTFSALTGQKMRDGTMKSDMFTLPDVLYPVPPEPDAVR